MNTMFGGGLACFTVTVCTLTVIHSITHRAMAADMVKNTMKFYSPNFLKYIFQFYLLFTSIYKYTCTCFNNRTTRVDNFMGYKLSLFGLITQTRIFV